MKTQIVLLMTLVLATAAAAQSGPHPGSDSAVEYLGNYAQKQASHAAADPTGYAQEKATPGALGQEANHTAWLACWAADDAGVPEPTGTCAQFYRAPGSVQPEGEPVNEEAKELANETIADVNATVQNVIDNGQAKIPDLPVDTPLEAFIDASQEMLAGFFEAVQDLLDLSTEGLETWLDESTELLDAFVGLTGAGFQLSADGYVAAADWSHDSALVLGQSVIDGAVISGNAVADGADAVGAFVAEAADAVTGMVAGWFGEIPAEADAEAQPDVTADVSESVDGLLGEIGDLSPM